MIHTGANAGAYYPLYDGNGNVTQYLKQGGGTSVTLVAHFDYDPFGRLAAAPYGNASLLAELPYRFSTKPVDFVTGLYYYGYRWYDPLTGRWPSRYPIGEHGGMNLYGFVGNDALHKHDRLGMWGEDTHRVKTTKWAIELGISNETAQTIGAADNNVDEWWSPISPSEENWSYHFDRTIGAEDSRSQIFTAKLQAAKDRCDFSRKSNDDPGGAAVHIGIGLHPLQDIYAHGDYNRIDEVPSIGQMWLGGVLWYIHNYVAPYQGSTSDPDDPDKDADTPSGFPTFSEAHYLGSPGLGWSNVVIGHRYRQGPTRITATENATKQALADLKEFIAANGGRNDPNCKCRKAFGVPID